MSFKRFDLLEAIELWAIDNNAIDSEQSLSDLFDNTFEDELRELAQQGDQCAIDQIFNDWSDGLCRDDMLHNEQYSNYCYVGEYAEV